MEFCAHVQDGRGMGRLHCNSDGMTLCKQILGEVVDAFTFDPTHPSLIWMMDKVTDSEILRAYKAKLETGQNPGSGSCATRRQAIQPAKTTFG